MIVRAFISLEIPGLVMISRWHAHAAAQEADIATTAVRVCVCPGVEGDKKNPPLRRVLIPGFFSYAANINSG